MICTLRDMTNLEDLPYLQGGTPTLHIIRIKRKKEAY
ncbi:MAG: hypothetical protein ACI956_002774 [Nonlabens sp.]|jgi:hypothetical protein